MLKAPFLFEFFRTTLYFKYTPYGSTETGGLIIKRPMNPYSKNNSTVQRTTSNHRLAAVNHAVRRLIGKEPQ